MKTFFVFIAFVVMHLRAMISSFVHIMPLLNGTMRFMLVASCVQSVSLHGVVQVAVWLTVTMGLQGLQRRHLLTPVLPPPLT